MKTGYQKNILRAVGVGLIVNILLTVLKLTSGIVGHSQALVSDGLNSFSDVFISLMLLVILRIATKKPDHDHPYGHEKFEGIAYFLLGIIFLLTAIFIGNLSIASIIEYIKDPSIAVTPDVLTLVVSVIALSIKFLLFRYYLNISKKYESPTLKADAKNHLLDAWATLFTVIGITLSQFNLVIFDYIASIIIGLFIFRLSVQILIESVAYLVDQAPSDEVIRKINLVIQSVSGVIHVDDLKVRKHMTQKYVDVEIAVQSSLTLEAAHKIAENVHHKVESTFTDVIHCMVHVNPYRL
ncbi:MAG: cation diffusion facilitator family transporter [Firmicutes bacterium]|nr:cation diffusion facilitator family transporter [Bacillota bacterium]